MTCTQIVSDWIGAHTRDVESGGEEREEKDQLSCVHVVALQAAECMKPKEKQSKRNWRLNAAVCVLCVAKLALYTCVCARVCVCVYACICVFLCVERRSDRIGTTCKSDKCEHSHILQVMSHSTRLALYCTGSRVNDSPISFSSDKLPDCAHAASAAVRN